MRTLYLCGAGNPDGVRLAMTINKSQDRWDRLVVLDDDEALHGKARLGVTIAGGFSALSEANAETDEVVNLVARTTRGRWRARAKIAEFGIPFATLIHPGVDTDWVTFHDSDITVYENATLCAGSSMGPASVVFMGAVLGHGASMGQCAVMAPGSVVNARVKLGDWAYFGSNASVLPDLEIGVDATVGSNSAVVQSVPEGATVMGVPAVVLFSRDEQPPVPQARGGVATEDVAELVQQITSIWKSVIGTDSVRPTDNFFDAGGSSLLALQARERMEKELGTAIAPTDLFRFPTVEALANHLAGGDASSGGRHDKRARLRKQHAATGAARARRRRDT